MSVSVTGVIRAINNLTKPLQEKALKKLGLSTKGLPGRTSDKAGITVGKDRRKIEKKIDKLKGGAVGAGGAGDAEDEEGEEDEDCEDSHDKHKKKKIQ